MKGEALQVIRHDYHAVHSSGARPLSAVKFIVLHCMETFSLVGADEGTGSWFENLASKGSAHFGVDDDSTQQYLPLTAVAWGAPPLNYNGVHIEASGRSALDRPKWLEDYDPMLTREAWLVAHLCRELAIPLRVLDAEDLARCGDDPAHKAGIVTHETVSAVFRQSDHTDPGPGLPSRG